MSSNFFSQTLWRSSRRKKLVMTLAHFQQVKISAVVEPRTGHFRGLVGFETVAYIGVARGGPGARALPIKIPPMTKNYDKIV